MKNLILTLIITLPLTLWGQGWEQIYESNHKVLSTIKSSDGGFLYCGYKIENNNVNGVTVKFDSNGNIEWEYSLNDLNQVFLVSVQETLDNGFICVGRYLPSEEYNSRVICIKIDENGNEIWRTDFNEFFDDILSESDLSTGTYIKKNNSEYYVSVDVYDINNNPMGVYFLNINEDGLINSSVELNFTSYVYDFIIDDNISIISPFDTSGTDQIYETVIFDLELDGSFTYYESDLYTPYNGDLETHFISSLHTNSNNDYYYISSFRSVSEEIIMLYRIVKLDSNGNVSWVNDFNYERDIDDITLSSTNNVISVGTDSSGVLFLSVINDNNQELSYSTFNFSNIRSCKVHQINNDNYVLIGHKYTGDLSGEYTEEVFIIKTDGNGTINSTTEIPLHNPNRKLEKTINLKGQEVKPKTGQPIINIFDDGSTQKKIIIE